ncbi:MAG: M15 family metallopeptidase [Methyloceanibacter sp.]
MARRSAPLLLSLLALSWMAHAHGAGTMPADFVYLRDVDSSIEQDIRYAGPGNFTGRPVPGYDAAECVLVRQAAEALRQVQAALKPKGLSLRVYDCYRPARAVSAFVAWVGAPDDPKSKAVYYPNLAKDGLIPDYIASRSGHSRGATVDLTLVPLADGEGSAGSGESQACTASQGDAAPDGSLAMGTTFDCFDTKANLGAPGLSEREARNREILRATMLTQGFKDYSPEWWHFTLRNEPHPDKYFDFPIVARR